ncbi:hypothetical protein ILYODFUR_006316 [Ilyodon furcidens]|uniref:Uncharacterized protein n=1 Tax=Ilyodon furcidens TaxID=33524 RepID=A0ABV0V3H2_9TELE
MGLGWGGGVRISSVQVKNRPNRDQWVSPTPPPPNHCLLRAAVTPVSRCSSIRVHAFNLGFPSDRQQALNASSLGIKMRLQNSLDGSSAELYWVSAGGTLERSL